MASPSQVLGRIFDITPLFENRNKEKKNTLYKSYILNRDKKYIINIEHAKKLCIVDSSLLIIHYVVIVIFSD